MKGKFWEMTFPTNVSIPGYFLDQGQPNPIIVLSVNLRPYILEANFPVNLKILVYICIEYTWFSMSIMEFVKGIL